MSSCLLISSSIPSSRKRPPFPRTNFAGAKTPLCVIDREHAKTANDFFASSHGRRPRETRYAANHRTAPSPQPPSGSPARRRPPATLAREPGRQPPQQKHPGGDGSPSDQTGPPAARGEARTLTALLRWRPGGRRYVHPRRRATPSLSRQPGYPSRSAGDSRPAGSTTALCPRCSRPARVRGGRRTRRPAARRVAGPPSPPGGPP